MKTNRIILLFCMGFAVCAMARDPIPIDLKVGNLQRQAVVYPSVVGGKSSKAASGKVPIVFCFHGHGGSAQQAARSFSLHESWPEALVVYPQGLPTPGQLTDPEGKRNGWQRTPGDQDDRDLKFYDALLVELGKRYSIDTKRVFVMGHSNGGGFTYLLWATRGKGITAVAPCAALAPKIVQQLTPKPCLHLAGTNDKLVRYAWQEHMMEAVKKINLCEAEGKTWAPGCLRYEPADKTKGAPMIQYIHNQGHRYPNNATALIVRFFKEFDGK